MQQNTQKSYLAHSRQKKPHLEASHLPFPSSLGQYKIGVESYNILIDPNDPNSERVSGFIWYPTEIVASPAVYSQFLPTKFGASANVLAASGPFPVIIHAPGFGTNADFAYQNCEHMASHGFIVIGKDFGFESKTGYQSARRYKSGMRLLDYVEERHLQGSLKNRFDLDKIGMFGYSAGFHDIISLTVGNQSQGFKRDSKARIKAVAFAEPYIYACGVSTSDWAKLNLPYITIAGSTYANGGNEYGLGASQTLFKTTLNAKPRYFVHAIGMTHLSAVGSLSGYTDAIREYELKTQAQPLVEPLSNVFLWQDNQFRLGAARSCPDVGIHSTLLRAKSSKAGGNHLYNPRMPVDLDSDEAGSLQRLYYTAFWKVYLEGDHRYKQFLSEDFTATQAHAQIKVAKDTMLHF